MGFLVCHLLHDISWYHNKIAVDRNGTVGVYGQCSCGKEYFRVLDTDKVYELPRNILKAIKIERIEDRLN